MRAFGNTFNAFKPMPTYFPGNVKEKTGLSLLYIAWHCSRTLGYYTPTRLDFRHRYTLSDMVLVKKAEIGLEK
jgi:hypothetical protein